MNITIRFPFELTIDIRAYLAFTFCLGWNSAWKDDLYIYIFFFIQSRPWRTRSIYLKVNKISVQFIAISKVCPFMHGIYLFTSVCIHHIYQYFPSRGIRILLRGIDSLKSFPPNCSRSSKTERSGKFLSFEKKKKMWRRNICCYS